MRAGGRDAITHWRLEAAYPDEAGRPIAAPGKMPAGNGPNASNPGSYGLDSATPMATHSTPQD